MTWHCSSCDTDLDMENRLQHFIDKHNFTPAQIAPEYTVEQRPEPKQDYFDMWNVGCYLTDCKCIRCANVGNIDLECTEQFIKMRCSACRHTWIYKRWFDRMTVITDGVIY